MKKLILFSLVIAAFCLSSCGGDGAEGTKVLISTPQGDVTVLLYDDTPGHKENFLKLAKEGYYDGTLFHRVIAGFMIQGGDPDSKGAAAGQRLGMGGPGYRVPAEIGKSHVKGALAAARDGNPEKASSGSQFYIVTGKPVSAPELDNIEKAKKITYSPEDRKKYMEVGGAPFLDGDYTVFGEVLEGMDVVDKIATSQKDGSDRPVEDITMTVKVL